MHSETARLQGEVERLRAALQAAQDENLRLVEARQQLLAQIDDQGRELRGERSSNRAERAQGDDRQSATEAELRVAFEELQVLTEEL
ncbi:MAG: hypothetical protein JO010_13375, partial [Alphaproteobacteria bacterium]|nr:hypothetical protein [Alphaproteobacteria bacterium]